MEWSESRPYGDYYTRFELRYDGDVSHRALAEFWRGILTHGRRLCAGQEWRWLEFKVAFDYDHYIQAQFTDASHHRCVPALFACPAIGREYDRLPQADGDVTEEALAKFESLYGQHLVRAAGIQPVPQLLADWRRERPIPVVLGVYDGWTHLEVGETKA